MKKILFVLLTLLLVTVLAACAQEKTEVTTKQDTTVTETAIVATTPNAEEMKMNQIKLNIGDSEFTATLYDTAAAKEFAARLPLTLEMQELHGNEKYYYFDSALSVDATVPESIHAGELKLYGDDCLVLFYDSFTTPYSYTDIGKLDNPDGLKEALGDEDVIIIFSLQE